MTINWFLHLQPHHANLLFRVIPVVLGVQRYNLRYLVPCGRPGDDAAIGYDILAASVHKLLKGKFRA